MVLLATPPHFRPMHLKAAIEAGKHCLLREAGRHRRPGRALGDGDAPAGEGEKPQPRLGPLLSLRHAEDRDRSSGIHDGAVGDIIALQTNYLTSGLWSNARKPEWSDMEWQLRNWLYFTWLSGDHIAEQHIHSLDKILWTMKDELPVKVTASGGRACRTAAGITATSTTTSTAIYEWKNGVRCFASCRQWVGCDAGRFSDWVFGTKGRANIQQHRITGENAWKAQAPAANMYDLGAHRPVQIDPRQRTPINNGDYMCKATLMAIMGRMSAYTGKTITCGAGAELDGRSEPGEVRVRPAGHSPDRGAGEDEVALNSGPLSGYSLGVAGAPTAAVDNSR